MKSCETDNIDLRQEIEKLRESQLTEIDQRCLEVDALKGQLSGQLSMLQQGHEALSHQVADLSAERNSLLRSVSELEQANQSLSTELVKQRQEWEDHLKNTSEHVAQVELEKTTFQAQLIQLQRCVSM